MVGIKLRLGKPDFKKMKYVYILRSLSHPDKRYTGMTDNLEERLSVHNDGRVPSSCAYRPWEIENYFAFSDNVKAVQFEQYLKSGSGRAFCKKHF